MTDDAGGVGGRPLAVPEEDWDTTPEEIRAEAEARCAHAVMRGARPDVAWRRAVRDLLVVQEARPDLDTELVGAVLDMMLGERRDPTGGVSDDVLDAAEQVSALVARYAVELEADPGAPPPVYALTGTVEIDTRVTALIVDRATPSDGAEVVAAPDHGEPSTEDGEEALREAPPDDRWSDVPDPDDGGDGPGWTYDPDDGDPHTGYVPGYGGPD